VPDSITAVRSLIFERLRPILVLKVLPLEAFQSADMKPVLIELTQLLLIRIFQVYEFEEVRKLSAEIVARLPPLMYLAQVSSKLVDFLNERNYVLAKVLLFALCNVALIHERKQSVEFYAIQLLPHLFAQLQMNPSNSQELQKFQRGTIDFLAILMKLSIIHSSATTDTTTALPSLASSLVLDPSLSISSLDELLPLILRLIRSVDLSWSLSFQICLVNVLITLPKMLPANLLGKLVDLSSNDLAATWKNKTKDPIIRAAVVQVLFGVVYHMKTEAQKYSADLLQLATEAIGDSHSEIRLNGLKLLGALMSAVEDLFVNSPSILMRVQTALQSIANIDSSTEARTLAEQYLVIFNSASLE